MAWLLVESGPVEDCHRPCPRYLRAMVKAGPANLAEPEPEGGEPHTASIPSAPAPPEGVSVATHEILFAPAEQPSCDACGGPLPPDDNDGFDLPGHGVYLWVRGDETRIEKAPLCSSCASAIGMTALARWEIEEEEG